VLAARRQGKGIRKTARNLGIGVSVVQRIVGIIESDKKSTCDAPCPTTS
jgi:hypothetical protein